MAKVQHPLFSQRAHGSIAATLTYQDNGTTQTVKRYRAPTTTPTLAQLVRRAMYRNATREWQELSQVEQATWKESDEQSYLDAYHRYLAAYLRALENLPHTIWDSNNTTWDDHDTTWD